MRNVARMLAIAGPLITIQSIIWEYTRMRPDYRFIVDPWSIRGFELTQGVVVAAIGVGLLIMGLLTMSDASRGKTMSSVVAGVMVVVGVAIAAVFADVDVEVTTGILLGLAFVYGYGLMKLSRRLLPDFSALGGMFGGLIAGLGLTIVSFVLFNSIIGERSLSPAIAAFLALAGLALVAVAGTPVEVTANRAFIFSSVVSGFVIARLGATMRSALIAAQIDVGAAAQYKDTQTTNGWLIAVVGIIITFVGAVGLWARRRDFINTQRRAAEQRAAAEKSAAEIAAAAAALNT